MPHPIIHTPVNGHIMISTDSTGQERVVLLCLLACLLTVPASAQINITPVNIGTTYIEWTWNTDLNLTDMYIDGNLMCGYETTSYNFTLSNLKPNESHTILLYDANTSGTDTTFTLPDISGAGTDDGSSGLVLGACGAVIGGIIMFARKRNEDEEELQ